MKVGLSSALLTRYDCVCKKLNTYVNTLQANGVANYNEGFKFAFEQFEQVIH